MRRFPADVKFRIFFYMSSVDFSLPVLFKDSSLGGSESACRVLAEALAARGHDVHIFATRLLPDVIESQRPAFLASSSPTSSCHCG
jgi:hypothetical protein